MRLKLNRLVLITCMALLGIIALQVFWLFRAYHEQQSQLFSVVDNAMMETQLFAGINSSLSATAQSLAADMLKEYSVGGRNSNLKDTLILKERNITIKLEGLPEKDSDIKREIFKIAGLDASTGKSYTLQTYKARIEKALNYKKVDLPFELALISINGAINACTIDTQKYENIGMKTAVNYSLPVTLNKEQSGRVQLAFPGATFYLLRGMGAVLLLSLCLTVICAVSFSYMVAIFFKQKKVAEIKNDFMNNMTHELKTPISSVSVALELLQDESVPVSHEVKEEYFNVAGNELKRLTMLVDKVLRMAAFEKLEVKLKPENFPVEDWIKGITNSVKPLAEAGKVNMDVHIKTEELTLFADKAHMSSVLQNLLENAIKYSDNNKPLLQINIVTWADEHTFFMKVEDNGAGIAGPYQQKIFDKFFRVPSGYEHRTKGYGLGLSYVKEIVKLHHGIITVESELKEGTIFTISIPKNS